MIDKRDGQTNKPVQPAENMFPKSDSKPENRPCLPSQKSGYATPVCDKK